MPLISHHGVDQQTLEASFPSSSPSLPSEDGSPLQKNIVRYREILAHIKETRRVLTPWLVSHTILGGFVKSNGGGG